MARFFLKPEQITGELVSIRGEDGHHIGHVLRHKVGDLLQATTGSEQLVVEIVDITGELVEGRIVQRFPSFQEPPVETILYQALPKGDKMEFVIQKAVELGVTEIVPFSSKYTIVKLDQKKRGKKQERWQRIAEEAGKQCQRDKIPLVRSDVTFSDVICSIKARSEEELFLMPYEHERQKGLREMKLETPKRISILIGSEGGFSVQEVEEAFAAGAHVVSLGPRILRTETAGLVALTLVGYLWGDLGGRR